MKKILDLIGEQVKGAFMACGFDETYAKVTLSNRPDLCEYQCNGAMAAAKMYKRKPIEIASQVVESLQGNGVFEQVEAVMPGFINMKLKPAYLAEYLEGMACADQYGCERAQKPMTIIVDYGGANVAKPLHVGHLRSAIIGESLKRMGRFLGHRVIGDVHLGDWGLQIGLVIEGLRERKPELVYFDESYTGEYPEEAPFTISELEEIYPAASARAKTDEEFSGRAHQATLKLQGGYRPYQAIWRHIIHVSVDDLKKNYAALNVTFDLWKGESDAESYIPSLIENLTGSGLAYESQGALVVDIAQEGDAKELPPCIVRKSDGAALYATSDLGTIMQREEDYQPDWYIYVVDKRQELHFTQVFRVAKKAGIVKEDTKMSFLGFGTMNGKDGRPFKTREGGIMRLEELIATIDHAVYERIVENRTVTDEEAKETARMVGLAALKYGDLSNQASKDYVFDMDRFISFEGNTGPYILYTIVRIKSIIAKYVELMGGADKVGAAAEDACAAGSASAAKDACAAGSASAAESACAAGSACAARSVAAARRAQALLPAASEAERALMLQLSRYNDVVESCFEELAPHKICQYVYELSNEFNRFYHDTKIIAEQDQARRASWIRLIGLTRDVLTTCIGLLGIEAPERM